MTQGNCLKFRYFLKEKKKVKVSTRKKALDDSEEQINLNVF